MSAQTYPVTRCQMDVLRFVAGFQEAHGYSPSYAEISDALNISSKGSVCERVAALEERGHLRIIPGKSRSIEILHKPALPRGPNGEPMHFVRVAEPA